jgi:hypothetical protein
MGALHSIQRKSMAAAALITAGAVLFAGCNTRDSRDLSDTRVQTTSTVPVAVSCEPTQRAIVRPTMINGAAMSQVECVSSGFVAGTTPVAYQPGVPTTIPAGYSAPYVTAQPAALDSTRVYPVAQQVTPRRVVYQRAPERVVRRQTRSVQKSAIIIGSSAGAGAGLGALAGGKKGALIGALVGGGGATLWDQITRNKQ